MKLCVCMGAECEGWEQYIPAKLHHAAAPVLRPLMNGPVRLTQRALLPWIADAMQSAIRICPQASSDARAARQLISSDRIYATVCCMHDTAPTAQVAVGVMDLVYPTEDELPAVDTPLAIRNASCAVLSLNTSGASSSQNFSLHLVAQSDLLNAVQAGQYEFDADRLLAKTVVSCTHTDCDMAQGRWSEVADLDPSETYYVVQRPGGLLAGHAAAEAAQTIAAAQGFHEGERISCMAPVGCVAVCSI